MFSADLSCLLLARSSCTSFLPGLEDTVLQKHTWGREEGGGRREERDREVRRERGELRRGCGRREVG